MSKKNRWKINWTSDKIMSTSALFISVISLVALLYQSYLAREENRLNQQQQSASVLPYLSQWYSEYNGQFKLIVGNKGVGPAFIKKVEIVLDSTKTFNNSNALFNEIFKSSSTLDSIQKVTSALVKGLVLPANDVINIIEIEGDENIDTFREVFGTKTVDFEIIYENVYGDRWQLSSDSTAPILLNQD